MKHQLRPALVLLILLTLITGVVYPLLVTGIGQGLFPARANGSLLVRGGQAVGSALIGQHFTGPGHFWGRPSATTPAPYDANASGGANLGPTNPALIQAVHARIAALRAVDPGNDAPVPVDLVTTSASGLDPDISPAAARYQAARVARVQAARVARVRGLPLERVLQLIDANTSQPFMGLFGQARVNVLQLNLALEAAR